MNYLVPKGNILNLQDNGMTMRDYFAAKALAGLLADSQVFAPAKEFAERSYELADAMLEARKQPVSK